MDSVCNRTDSRRTISHRHEEARLRTLAQTKFSGVKKEVGIDRIGWTSYPIRMRIRYPVWITVV